MNRRGFVGLIGAAVAGAAYDEERALWVPGKKLISIPAIRSNLRRRIWRDKNGAWLAALYYDPRRDRVDSMLVDYSGGQPYTTKRHVVSGPFSEAAYRQIHGWASVSDEGPGLCVMDVTYVGIDYMEYALDRISDKRGTETGRLIGESTSGSGSGPEEG